MSKKILKRSFALGALMAVVITGNVYADNTVISTRPSTASYTTSYSDIDFKGITYSSDGGVFNFGSAPIQFTNCNFLNNKVDVDSGNVHGGAIHSSRNLSITGGSFVGNNVINQTQAVYGGAISQSNSSLSITGTFFKGNDIISYGSESPQKYGVAIYASKANVTIANCEFVENGGSGGNSVIFGTSGTTINVNDGNRFEKNIANSVNSQTVNDKIIFSGTNKFIGNRNLSIINNGTLIFNSGSITTFDNSAYSHSIWNKGTGVVNVNEGSIVDSEGAVESPGIFNIGGKIDVGGTAIYNSNFNETNISDSGVLNANGYINFKKTTIDGTLNVTETGNSNFTGTTTINGILNVKENGKANFTSDTVINGKLNLSGDSNLNTISGDGEFNFLKAVDVSVKENNSKALKFTATGVVNDAIGGDVNKLIKKIDWNTDAVMVMEEGDIQGKVTAYMTENKDEEEFLGNLKVYYQKEETNTKNQAVTDNGVALKLHWRSHLSDMNKRMGELRDAHGELGVWTRMVRGENEYKGTKAQYNQYQLGYDEKLSVDKRWTVGTAITFAEGDASYGYGTTDDKSTAFTIYGSKLNNDGSYVDLIVRYEHLESKLDDVNSGKGDYGTNGFSVGAEFGKRFDQNDGAWIEPQVQLTYGTVDSAEFVIGGKNVQVGDMDSLIGRIGFRIGQDIEQGNVYARASYLYDFDGKTEATFSNTNTSRTIKEDLGGGWWEVGIGTNINLSKATYLYAEVDKTFGGEVDTNWQWNLGVRYSF